MSVNNIPSDHLMHLAKKGGFKNLKTLLDALYAEDKDARKQVLDSLDDEHRARLAAAYAWDRSRIALNVFTLPNLELKSALAWARKAKPNSTILSMSVKDGRAWGTIRFVVSHSFQRKGERVSTKADKDVDFVVREVGGKVIAEIYSSTNFAKRAAEMLISLLGGEVSRDARVLAQFSEEKAFQLAKFKDWLHVGVGGDDAIGTVGKVAYNGKRKGTFRAGFPVDEKRIKAHLACKNDSNDFGVDFKHPDGHVEHHEVRFVFGAHSHLILWTCCSAPAAEAVVDLIL